MNAPNFCAVNAVLHFHPSYIRGNTQRHVLEMFKFHGKWKSVRFWRPTFKCTRCILRTHASLRLRQAFEKTSFECEDFFPCPESLLPWQQQKICSKGSWVSECVSWACRGMAVPNKQALSLTVSQVLLLPSHCSPYPLPPSPPTLTSLLLISGFYLAGLLFSCYLPIPAIQQTYLLSLFKHFFLLTPYFIPS